MNSTDNQKKEEEANLYVQVYTVLSDDVWVHIEDWFKMAKLNITKNRLGRADNDIIRSMKQWLIVNTSNDIARCLWDLIDEG